MLRTARRLEFKIFTLPMRHWNREWNSWKDKLQSIFTLPMRHWNSIIPDIFVKILPDFYSTYEALKLVSFNSTSFFLEIFTLPMRHWNVKLAKATLNDSLHFYSTYEALKRISLQLITTPPPTFLLYLWGIETFCRLPVISGRNLIFTLPMRHWNFSNLSPIRVVMPWFLLYLWGIETIKNKNWRCKMQNFYSTYEALKLLLKNPPAGRSSLFLLYLWGIETYIL